MTGLDVDARHIRDAIERDLAGYHAPADLPERARLGGRRRARRTRVRRVAGAAAVACAVAVAVVAVVAAGPQAGPGPAASAGLPSARSVGKAMLTAFGSVSGDILSSTEVDTSHGTVVDTYQDWNWPGQPAPGQLARDLRRERSGSRRVAAPGRGLRCQLRQPARHRDGSGPGADEGSGPGDHGLLRRGQRRLRHGQPERPGRDLVRVQPPVHRA